MPDVLIYHGERADGRLSFMFSGIVGTLAAGFASIGASVRTGAVPHASSTSRAALSALASEALRLRRGDIFVWVGVKQHAMPPWEALGAAGIRRVYYQTEPLAATAHSSPAGRTPTCLLPPARYPAALGAPLPRFVDEVWDYSRANIAACARHPHAPRQRHVPPGFVPLRAGGAAGPRAVGPAPTPAPTSAPGWAPISAAEVERPAIFLGDASLAQRGACFSGELRALVSTRNDVWSAASLSSLCDGSRGKRVFVNVHKSCASEKESEQPAEFVRLSQLLSCGAYVISQASSPADETELDGLVDFATLRRLPASLRSLRKLAADAADAADAPLADAAERRAALFRERFAPAAIFRRANVTLDLAAESAGLQAGLADTPASRPAHQPHARDAAASPCAPGSACCARHPRAASCSTT